MPMYNTCPKCGANLDPGESCDCDSASLAKEAVEEYAREQEKNGCSICPRCGKLNRMFEEPEKNALSRQAHIYICSQCGMNEAIKDALGDEPLPFEKWAIAKLRVRG